MQRKEYSEGEKQKMKLKLDDPYGKIWAGQTMKDFFIGLSPNQIQPNGIDLTVDEIYFQTGNPIMSDTSIKLGDDQEEPRMYKGELALMLPKMVAGLSPDKGGWMLQPGSYIVQWAEPVTIPYNAIGLIFPRSSLLRMGNTLCTAVWDRGYMGVGRSLLIVNTHMMLERHTRLGQMIFIPASNMGKGYSGQYMKEGMKDDKEEK